MKKVKVEGEGEGEERKAKKPKMTAEQKLALAACKIFGSSFDQAKEINELSFRVRHEMCRTCANDGCKEVGPNIRCVLASIASVAFGMILEAKGGAK